MPLAVSAILRASWGWSVRNPLASAGGPGLLLPPPSTIVGMIAKGVAKSKGWGEAEVSNQRMVSTAYRLAEKLLAAGAGILEGHAVSFRDIQRQLNIPYLRPQNRMDPKQWFSVQGFGVTFSPQSRICVSAVFADTLLDIISVKELEASARSITIMGSKEGLVTVEDASIERVDESMGGESGYYTPLEAIDANMLELKVVSRKSILYWDPRDIRAYSKMLGRKTKDKPARILEFLIPIRKDVGFLEDVAGGHGGGEDYFIPLKEDYITYRVPGPCGSLAKLPG